MPATNRNPNSPLDHLSPEQLQQLISRYYDPEKTERVRDLAAEFNISLPNGGLASLFPPVTCNELRCPHCSDTALIQKRASRGSRPHDPECPACGHIYSGNCRCDGCAENAARIKADFDSRKRRVLEAFYRNDGQSLSRLEKLSLREAIYLLAIVRHSIDENFRFIDPFGENTPPFAPTEHLRFQIVKHLYARGLIAPSPLSKSDAFVFDDALTTVKQYYLDRVLWELLPGATTVAKRDLIESLQQIAQDQKQWPTDWQSERYAVWIEIAKFECIEYYHHQLHLRGFKLGNPGEKTYSVFETLLERLSVAQIYSLIFNAARTAGDRTTRENTPRFQIANGVIGSILRDAERREANKWEITAYRRDFKCPATALSTTFFDLFLGIGASAFTSVPSK